MRHAVAGAEAEAVGDGVEHRGEAAVLDHHRLRQAGRPRGVDQVGEVAGARGSGRLRGSPPGRRVRRGSRTCPPASCAGRTPRWITTAGSASASRAARRSGGEAGSSGTQAPPAFQTPQQGDRHVGRAVEQQRHPRLRRRPRGRAAGAPAPSAPRVELGEGERPRRRDATARASGVARGLRGEALAAPSSPASGTGRVVPFGDDLVARRGGEHRQRREAERPDRPSPPRAGAGAARTGARRSRDRTGRRRTRASPRDPWGGRTASAADRSGRCRRRRPPPRR